MSIQSDEAEEEILLRNRMNADRVSRLDSRRRLGRE